MRRGDRGFHALEPDVVFWPDIGLEPQRLCGIGQVDWRDVAALEARDLDVVDRRMISAPFGSEGHRDGLRPDMHAAEVVMIAVDHQVDPRARPDPATFEARRTALVRQPRACRAEVGGPHGYGREGGGPP